MCPKASKTVKTKKFFSFFLYKEAAKKKFFFETRHWRRSTDGNCVFTRKSSAAFKEPYKNGGAGDPFDETAGAAF
jgi:hypothetical protein